MNKLTKIFGTFFLAASLQATAGDCPVLSGQFTIGTSETADFSTVSEAVNALKCGGVSAPTTFLIEDGTYTERVVLSSIPGADANNRITFESKSGNYSEVIISYGNADATLVLNGTSYVNFQNLTIDHKSATYGSSVRIDGKANNINFNGVTLTVLKPTELAKTALQYTLPLQLRKRLSLLKIAKSTTVASVSTKPV
jgi:pectin methylesterase-like acyl-CoA thioesterase